MIKEMQSLNQSDFNETIRGMQKEVDGYLEDDDLKWRQRAKIKWLRDGDRYIKYFHSFANQRKQLNTIDSILTREVSWDKSYEGISSLFK